LPVPRPQAGLAGPLVTLVSRYVGDDASRALHQKIAATIATTTAAAAGHVDSAPVGSAAVVQVRGCLCVFFVGFVLVWNCFLFVFCLFGVCLFVMLFRVVLVWCCICFCFHLFYMFSIGFMCFRYVFYMRGCRLSFCLGLSWGGRPGRKRWQIAWPFFSTPIQTT
jgi:hypothetical protein